LRLKSNVELEILRYNLSSMINDKRTEPLLFCTQNPDEKVLKILRRGFVLELPWLILFVLVIGLLTYLGPFIPNFIMNKDAISLVDFVRVSLIIMGLAYGLNRYFNWFYSVNIITNQRLLDFEFNELGIKSITECQIKNIQSVNIKNEGFLSFLFGLATLNILTSGDNPNIDFEYIYNSNEIQDLVSDLTRGAHTK
jgi:hypothetical protein